MNQLARYLLFLSLLAWGSAFAQLSKLPLNLTVASLKPADSQVIPVGELPRRIVEESSYAEQAVQKSSTIALPDADGQELESISRDLNALGKKLVGKAFQTLPRYGVEALEQHLVFLDDRLTQLQDDLKAISRPLSDEAGELAQKRKSWQEARQSYADVISPELLENIDNLDNDLQTAEKALSAPLSSILSQSQQARHLQTRVADDLQTVRDQIVLIERSLWRFDSESLFTVLQEEPDQGEHSMQAVLNGISVQIDFTKAFDRQTRSRHILVAILAVLALPILLLLSRKAKVIIDQNVALERYRMTMSRPYSAWIMFIVGCMLVSDFNGPMFREKFLLAVAWLPVMRLQPRWMHENIGAPVYATGLFFVLSLTGHLLTGFPLEFRLVQLLNGVLLLGTLGWLFYRLPAGKPEQPARKERAARAMIIVSGALIALAVIVNIFGATRLAPLLTDGALSSLYLALCLFAIRELVRAYTEVLVTSGTKMDMANTQHAGRLFEVVQKLFNLALFMAWLAGTLAVFRILPLFMEKLELISKFTLAIGNLSITIGGIVLFCLSVLLSFWIAKTIRVVLSDDVLPNMKLPRGVANSVSTMSYYFLLVLGLLVALTAAGFELSQLAIIIGALSVGIGFGLNTMINNFVSGLILMVERPIQPGDVIELSGTTGKVRNIGIRATTLSTFEGADVLVPNGMLLAEKLTNWTLMNERRRIEIPVGVSYGCDPRTVQSLLFEVAKNTEGVSHEPLPPTILFIGFGESTLDFSVRAWTDDFNQSPIIRSEMAIAIHAALKQAGIAIPFPQRDVHIHTNGAASEQPVETSASGMYPGVSG